MPARKSPPRTRRRSKPSIKKDDVFLNVPYDGRFENLLLAYIAGITAFGFVPRATLAIPFSQRRLERIISLIASSQYSVHDLSRVELDRTCEARPHRIKKSLSDIDGTDVYIHGGTVRGVFRELCNAFVRNRRQPSVLQMMQIYRMLRSKFAGTLRAAGAKDPFNARVFRDLCVLASAAADELVVR
jgi:hypothetical protein